MHVLSITKLLSEIFFNKDFDISKLESLTQQEKDIFADYISKSRVESYVLKSIGEFGAKTLGIENFFKLKNNGDARTIRTLENIRFSKKINFELSNKKIKHVFLKGINMHQYIYSNEHTIRPISDIDILIEKKDLTEVLNVIHDLGFDISKWQETQKEGFELYRNPNPFHKNGQAQLDIHTTIKGSIYGDKIDFNSFASDLIHSDQNFCNKEDLFINCLFHGTRQSNYNVGPIFIIDLWHFFHLKEISWPIVSKKVTKYGLEREMNYVLKYFRTKVALPLELKKFLKPCDITESELNTIFLAEPKNSSLFSAFSINGLQILAKKFFSKKYIKDHSLQKFTVIDFWTNFFHLLTKNLNPRNKVKGEMMVSKARFKLLRKGKKIDQ